MRSCPKCKVPFDVLQKTFAEVDVCPQCGGVFLDPGEGVSMNGADSDGSFLVADGQAKLVRRSQLECPATEHPTSFMDVYAMGSGTDAIEFEHCPRCKGFFLDKGEGAALDALDAAEVRGATGARFEQPPEAGLDRQALAIAQSREGSGKSFFMDFVTDCLRSVRLSDGAHHRRHHHRRIF